MSKIFTLCLSEHNKWGYILSAHLAEEVAGKDYLLLQERITGENMNRYKLPEAQQKLVQWIDQYSDKEMACVLRRNTSTREFLQSLTEEIISKEIRPYIERRLLHCFDLLPQCDTRIFLKDNTGRIYLDQALTFEESPAEAVFNFHYDPEEGLRYFLSVFYQGEEIKLLGKPLITLVNQPSIMVLQQRLLRFRDIDSKKLMPFVKKASILVPRHMEEKYFNTFVIDNIRKYRTQISGFVLEEEPSEPVPVISLENDLRYLPVLRLRFDYGNGRVFDAARPMETEASLLKNGAQYIVKRFRRNRDAEETYLSLLQKYGFHDAGNSMFYLDETVAQNKDTDKEQCLANLVERLNNLSGELTEKGFLINQHFLPQKYFIGSVKLEVELKTAQDWFDVHAIVHFGGFKIPFTDFRDHIIRQDRNYTLPNGEVLILPAEWLSKYAQIMLLSEKNSNNLRISKRYFMTVNDTFEGLEYQYRESLLNLCHAGTIKADDAPISIRATLRPYQLQGVSWMQALREHSLGGCLADDMGLGKTLQTISLLQSITDETAEEQPVADDTDNTGNTTSDTWQEDTSNQYVQLSIFDAPVAHKTTHPAFTVPSRRTIPVRTPIKPSLIVMPASLIHNWANELARFTPNLKVLRYVGAGRPGNTRFDRYHIILTTYGVLRNDLFLPRNEFLYLILDEAQYIKNPASKTYQAVLQVKANYFLSLSGTPIENSLVDLWAQMNFLNRGLLGDLNFFREHFVIPIEKHNDEHSRQKLQRLVQPFLLRRTKQEVAPELPDLTEQIRYCEMTEAQRSLYEEEKSKARNEVLESIGEQGISKSSILIFRALNRLRQLAIHPAMLDQDYTLDSGKFNHITENLENLHSEGHKVLLFSSFTKHLDLIARYLEQQGLPYAMLTGRTRNREEVIYKFNNDPAIPFFLISLKAGGVGLNLTAAGYVFLLDPWWNPAAEQQAISRTHRIGQQSKVFAYRMISLDTIEEKIIRLQEKKSALANIFAQSDAPFRNMTVENVMELFE